MPFTCMQVEDVHCVLCNAPDFAIHGEESAMDVLNACAEHRAQRILIEGPRLPEEFFDLKTRVAGLFLQKLANYRCVCAFVIDLETITIERFGELIREANRGNEFRFFDERSAAEAWLARS